MMTRSGGAVSTRLGMILALAGSVALVAANPAEARTGEAALVRADGQLAAPDAVPEMVTGDQEGVRRVLRGLREGDERFARALDAVRDEADKAMDAPIVVVTDKAKAPPGGSKNDYASLSPYWWPDPESPNGLPYIRRDGEVNPERYEYDVDRLNAFTKAVRALGLAYFYTGDERYAERANEWLRAWFMTPETRMNPSLNFAQFVPGVSDGRKYGIIETNRMRWMLDAMRLMEARGGMESDVAEATRSWLGEFLEWLRTSQLGRSEMASENNHGTWWGAQVAMIATYLGRDDVVREMGEFAKRRIGETIEPDGSQPHELTRTKSFSYSNFNLRALMDMAHYAERVGMDIWDYEAPNGATMQQAMEVLMPYITDQEAWPHKQISEESAGKLAETLRLAARGFEDMRYERAIDELSEQEGDDPVASYLTLLMPPLQPGS